MTTKVSLAQSKAKKQRAISKKPEPVYVPFEGDLSSEDRLTALRTRFFYLMAEAQGVSQEIARLGGGDVWKP